MDPMAYIAIGSTSGPRFAGAMKWLSKGGPFDDSFIVDSYPWADLGSGTVVDVSIIPLAFFERWLTEGMQVGGGTGHMSVSIAAKFPELKFIVQDLEGQGKVLVVPEDLHGRVTFQAHDFFTDQPVSADAYILRFILHDWPDNQASEILRRLIPALKPGKRIILIETIMPEFRQLPSYGERFKMSVNPDPLYSGRNLIVT
jgi:hypothetical protein